MVYTIENYGKPEEVLWNGSGWYTKTWVGSTFTPTWVKADENDTENEKRFLTVPKDIEFGGYIKEI